MDLIAPATYGGVHTPLLGELLQRSELAQTLIEQLMTLALLVSPDGVILEGNRAARLTAEDGELTSRNLWDALPCAPESAARLGETVARAARGEFAALDISLVRSAGQSDRLFEINIPILACAGYSARAGAA